MDPETNRDEVTNVGVKDGTIVTISGATPTGVAPGL
jgi:hypothetical protein